MAADTRTRRRLRVLLAPETANLAETTRMIEVGRALRARGHEVLAFGYSPRFAPLVGRAGLEYLPQAPVFSEVEARRMLAADQGRSVRHPFTPVLVETRVRGELGLYADLSPDVLVTGSNLTALASARIAGLPVVYVKPFALSGPHLAESRAGRAMRAVPYAPAGFRRVLRRAGLRGVSMLDLLEADLNLVTSTPAELATRGAGLPPHYRAVGPIFARLPGPLPEWIVELGAGPRPVVYAALGSSATPRLAAALLSCLAELDAEIVAPLAGYLSPGAVADLPPTVHVCDLVPAHLLGPVARAAVLHGGEGTVQAAGASGLPFVGIPLQREQRWNVDQRVAAGAALRATPAEVHAGEHVAPIRRRFLGKVERALTDPAMRSAAAGIARDTADHDGGAAAAVAVEQFCATA